MDPAVKDSVGMSDKALICGTLEGRRRPQLALALAATLVALDHLLPSLCPVLS